MGLQDIAPQIKSDNYWKVTEDTFGHLAPKKNTTYRGEINVAVGHYDNLNPTIMNIKMNGLEDTPWLFESVQELLWNIGDEVLKAGNVYKIKATFRNYRWWTKLIKYQLN